jgi:hypothetical protein
MTQPGHWFPSICYSLRAARANDKGVTAELPFIRRQAQKKAMSMLAGDPRRDDVTLGSTFNRQATERIDGPVRDRRRQGGNALRGRPAPRDAH